LNVAAVRMEKRFVVIGNESCVEEVIDWFIFVGVPDMHFLDLL